MIRILGVSIMVLGIMETVFLSLILLNIAPLP